MITSHITSRMVMEFNHVLSDANSGVRLTISDITDGFVSIELTLSNTRHIEVSEIRATESFYQLCNSWFKSKGVKLVWNNTKTLAWEQGQDLGN